MADQDDLLKRAERLKREQEATRQAEQNASRPIIARLLTGMLERSTVMRQIAETLDVLWNHWLKPLAFIINPLVQLYWQVMKWLFARFAFVGGAYDKYRGAATALVLTVFTVVFGWMLVARAVPFTVTLAYDAVAINLFSHQDTLIFSQPQNVEGEPDVLRIYACRMYPCEGQTDSVEFRVRDSSYLDLVRMLTRFEPHDPGELAGAFVSEENACTISAYGVRNKWLGWYPYITAATCQSINGSNYDEVLDQMRNLLGGH